MMRWSLLFLLFVLAVACSEKEERSPIKNLETRTLEPERTRRVKVGSFSMQAANTKRGAVDDKELAGKVWVGVTIFTHCPGICPIVTQVFRELQDEFKADEDFRLLSVTVDPARDTVPMLQKFAAGYGADNSRWYFVRHPERAAIGKFVTGNLHLQYIEEEPLLHPPHIVLVDRDGTIVGMWDGTDRAAVVKLRAAIRRTLDAKKAP